MDYFTLLFFGCIVGIQHALEADHLAAVAALCTGTTSRRTLVLKGSVWGIGHTITLLGVCGVLLFLGKSISPHTSALLELAVGAMIVGLGLSVLYKLLRRRVHFHFHRHEHGLHHLHAHSHPNGDHVHSNSNHDHEHRHLGLRRSLLVGVMHGVAGSAALLVLAAATNSFIQATMYILAFGAGSIIGMATLSFVASYPLRLMQRSAGWLNRLAFACIGCAAVTVGAKLIGASWSVL